jgi:FtsP/CotA-like multicopper oxidase with cupredoxin domain
LGTTEEWELSADFVSHPFHIHVNPFQIVAVEVNYDGNWIDVSAPDSIDDFQVVDGKLARGGPVDPQYRGIKGQWMDTIFVKNIAKKPGPNSSDFSYRVKIRTRYNKYTGQFVLHCHTLDHEDQGMMQNVVIEP